ncbi:hypothetical protein [uncultured Roseibium sp.]|nr:hypothetical protein [uncultured Roseibium sp.]
MRQKNERHRDAADRTVKDIHRKTRKREILLRRRGFASWQRQKRDRSH